MLWLEYQAELEREEISRALEESLRSLLRANRRVTTRGVVRGLERSSVGEGESEEDCSICLDGYKRGQAVTKMPCGHEFHSKCLERWLLNYNATCPYCRAALE
jgi:hypothetical protein